MNGIEIDIDSIVPLKSNTKCGELYYENLAIKCVCVFCKKSFETITIFTNHLLEDHLYFNANATNNTEETEIKPDLEENMIELEISQINEDENSTESTKLEPEDSILLYPPQPKNISRVQKYGRSSICLYNCKKCQLSFYTRNAWRIHYRKHHQKNIPYVPNICHICNKSLCSKDSLRRHIAVHSEPVHRYKCNYCPHTCTLKGNLTQHEKLHHGEKAEKCDYCDKRFHLKFEKSVHERRVHTKERPYQCEICGRKFFTSTLMNNHKKRHTNTRNHQCQLCDKKFYDNQLLKDHMISHSDEKPHECHVCMAKFGRRKALKQHIKIHDDIKQYNCLLCDKAFAQKPGLYSHMKSHAKQDNL